MPIQTANLKKINGTISVQAHEPSNWLHIILPQLHPPLKPFLPERGEPGRERFAPDIAAKDSSKTLAESSRRV
jgi:hypothetical protein